MLPTRLRLLTISWFSVFSSGEVWFESFSVAVGKLRFLIRMFPFFLVDVVAQKDLKLSAQGFRFTHHGGSLGDLDSKESSGV
jgi:hypothetical protein